MLETVLGRHGINCVSAAKEFKVKTTYMTIPVLF